MAVLLAAEATTTREDDISDAGHNLGSGGSENGLGRSNPLSGGLLLHSHRLNKKMF